MPRPVVLVTGASRGIGAAVAERQARDGWDVLVHYHRERAGAEATAKRVAAAGGRAVLVQADLADRAAAERVAAECLAAFGRVDAVVNNAGVYERARTPDVDEAAWDRALDANLKGAFFLTRAALPHLPRGGRVVSVSSFLAQTGSWHGSHYAASKAGLEALTRSWAKEFGPRGILVNAVAPGPVATDILAGDTPEERAKRERQIPIGRVGEAADIAGVVAFLLGPDSAFVTGVVIPATGGRHLA